MSLSSWNQAVIRRDLRALKILSEVYWTKAGWRVTPLNHPDGDHARRAGYLYDRLSLHHDEAIDRATRAVRDVDRGAIADAFLASLGSRRLELRSGLGSYALASVLPDHSFTGTDRCHVCGQLEGVTEHDFGAQNLERYKWGGVRHLDPAYMWFDLFLFSKTERPRATAQDGDILREILRIVVAAPEGARPDDLVKALAGVLPSNQWERRILLEILSFAGILEPTGRPVFSEEWVDCEAREDPLNSWRYPFAWWRGAAGVNQASVQEYFPSIAMRAR